MTLENAIADAREQHELRRAVGFDQDALELAAKAGFENGEFEESEDEIPEVLEEFFPEGVTEDSTVDKSKDKSKPSLLDKLESKSSK